jgi:hypothetical protein
MTDVLSTTRKAPTLKRGDWVRMKRGIYKGDLAQVLHPQPPTNPRTHTLFFFTCFLLFSVLLNSHEYFVFSLLEVYDYDEARGIATVRLIPRLDLVAWERRQRGEPEDGDDEQQRLSTTDESGRVNNPTRKRKKSVPPAKFFNPEEIRVRNQLHSLRRNQTPRLM